VTSPCGLPVTTWRVELKIVSALSLTAAWCFAASSAACFFSSSGHRLLQHFGVGDQIFAECFFDVAAPARPRCSAHGLANAPSVKMMPAARAKRVRKRIVINPSVEGPDPHFDLELMISSALTQPGEPIGTGLGACRKRGAVG